MLVSQLNQKHATWTKLAPFWERMDLLTVGGYEMLQRAMLFLREQPMEPPSVYAARLLGASYQNIFGTALGWYGSRLFHEAPQFHFRRNDSKFEDDGLAKFLNDADRGGCSLIEIAQTKWFANLVSLGCVYVALDLPVAGEMKSEREQRAAGALDPYLVTFDPRQVYDWDADEHGHITRIVIATVATRNGAVVDRWYVYDVEVVSVYEAERKDGKADEKSEAKHLRTTRHALAGEKRVPVRRIVCPPELWFGWRVYPQVIEHFNASNARSWLLQSACLPIPWIKGEFTNPPKASVTEWLQLAENGDFGWTEPAGVAFEHARDYVVELREEIHRQMYLQAQARSTDATPAAQSGLSKQADMQPSSEVLDGFGAIFRAAFKAILADVLLIRGESDVTVDVQGMHFETDELGEIETAQAALDLGVPSETFRKLVFKAVARCVAKPDPDTQKRIDSEIDAAPTEAERQAAALQEAAASLAGNTPGPQA
jgi:hypothetical protein